MSIILKGSDFISNRIYDCPLIVKIHVNNQEVLLCIDARVLSQDPYNTTISKNKEYKFFPTIGIVIYDGGENYMSNPHISDDPIGYKIGEENPIMLDNKVIGYKGKVTCIVEDKEIFLPNIGITADGVKMIQSGFHPGDTFLQKEIGDFTHCSVLSMLGIDIPISSIYHLIPGKKYTFDCSFGNQPWMEFMYGEYKATGAYKNALFLSGLIIDADFDPQKNEG